MNKNKTIGLENLEETMMVMKVRVIESDIMWGILTLLCVIRSFRTEKCHYILLINLAENCF